MQSCGDAHNNTYHCIRYLVVPSTGITKDSMTRMYAILVRVVCARARARVRMRVCAYTCIYYNRILYVGGDVCVCVRASASARVCVRVYTYV